MNDRTEQIVRTFLDLFHAAEPDLAQIAAMLSPEAHWQAAVPIAPIIVGADAICAEVARQYRLYSDCRCVIVHIASADGTVFSERIDTVRMADGREVTTRVVGVFDVDQEGRIAAWREYWDLADIARQIGITAEELAVLMNSASA